MHEKVRGSTTIAFEFSGLFKEVNGFNKAYIIYIVILLN